MSLDIRHRVTNFLKYNRIAYNAYYYGVSSLLRIAGAFSKTDEHLILFNSFGGRRFDDSPRAIFEAMKKDPRFKGFHIVWALHDPDAFNIDGAEKVRSDTPAFFATALKARVWITNSSMERGLSFRSPKTLYVNSWHGSPIKRMGRDIAGGNAAFSTKAKEEFDIFCVQGEFDARIFSDCFQIPGERMLRSGLPRNDELVDYSVEKRSRIRETLGIPENKIAVLYCPTFREYDRTKDNAVTMAPPIDLAKWESRLEATHVLLVRAHYEVTNAMEIRGNSFVRNVSDYPNLNELIIAADVLLSDYSSIYFDWSITGKPMLHFCYDYEKYAHERGMYFDVREKVDGSEDEDGLIDLLQKIDMEKASVRTRQFREEFVDYYGKGCKSVLDWLAASLKKGERSHC